MMYSGGGDWRGPPTPAQFSLRVAILGGVGLVVIAIIFLRLWYLEVLSGDRYLAEAQNNQVREFRVQAPRGEILDRDGRVLVDNRTALELQVKETELPKSAQRRTRMFERLGEVAGMSPERIRKEIRRQTRLSPASPVTLKRDVPVELVYFLRENQARFPGASVERVYVRRYPMGTTAAHLLGYVREIDEEQLEDPRYETLEPGDTIGRDGVEYAYDSLLRGVNGATRVKVDATGTPTGQPLTEREPQEGNDLTLTIDADVQRAGEAAISRFGLPGAFVAMKVNDGEVVGLGSTPTYDPSVLARPSVPQAVYDQIFGSDPETSLSAPAVNRATASAYPTGSTFKPVTAIAALDSGNLTTSEVISDPGSIEVGGQTFENAGGVPHGAIALRQALQVSSDVFFYIMGMRTNEDAGDGGPIQDWARRLGLGEPTGIEIPGEAAGNVPSPDWRNELYEQHTDPDSPCGEEVCVDRGEFTDRPWSIGDNIQLAVGQGDLQADPLQMAVAYAAIANGGTIVRPHVGWRVEDPAGQVIQEIEPAPRREVEIDPVWRQTILDGLRDAAMTPSGTSYNVFGGFPVEIAGKTGTAERPPYEDQSWYVAIAPYDDPKYVVAVTIEEGGFGADAAAPAASEILTKLLKIKPAKIDEVANGEAAVYE